jgi:NAD(P)-dependent dehydrogenase (short-subunit alcohol dehydrogenase family)
LKLLHRRRGGREVTGLSGKTAIVTGAGRGIGQAIALELSAQGARVALLARSTEEIDAVRKRLIAAAPSAGAASGAAAGAPAARGLAPRAASFRCDVTDPESVRTACAAAEAALGPADILVNGAGDAVAAPFAKTDLELWERLLRVNLTSAFLVTKQVLPGMTARGWGRIVNVASVAGLAGAAYVSAYTAAKHGLVGLTRALSQEVAKNGVTVNAVCPGYVDTPMTDRSVANIAEKTGMSPEKARAFLSSRSPQDRMMTPEEVAGLVLYLVSDAARGVNGQAITLDGGGLVA